MEIPQTSEVNGLAVATLFIILLYLSFPFGYTDSHTELACAIPRAGGAFDDGLRALGPQWGFLAGMAQNVEGWRWSSPRWPCWPSPFTVPGWR